MVRAELHTPSELLAAMLAEGAGARHNAACIALWRRSGCGRRDVPGGVYYFPCKFVKCGLMQLERGAPVALPAAMLADG